MIAAILVSGWLIFLAELGDKSQLIALAMATRYRPAIVLLGITIATGFNHFLSVLIGGAVSALIPLFYINFLAGAAFIIFAFWTIRGDKLDDTEDRKGYSHPLLTITLTFFLAELGDKTMLATITVSTTYQPFGVWVGSTFGMVLSDALALLVGTLLGRNLPERAVKFGAAAVFLVFGLIYIKQAVFPV